tara:strand:+ start:13988 stop:14242 length:255 start_codon:yes stop_codon:yes gene_type:complete
MSKATAKAAAYALVTSAFGVTGSSLIPGDYHPVVAIAAIVLFAIMLIGDFSPSFRSKSKVGRVTHVKSKRRKPPRRKRKSKKRK